MKYSSHELTLVFIVSVTSSSFLCWHLMASVKSLPNQSAYCRKLESRLRALMNWSVRKSVMHSIYNIIKVRKEREIREKIGFEFWVESVICHGIDGSHGSHGRHIMSITEWHIIGFWCRSTYVWSCSQCSAYSKILFRLNSAFAKLSVWMSSFHNLRFCISYMNQWYLEALNIWLHMFRFPPLMPNANAMPFLLKRLPKAINIIIANDFLWLSI